MGTEVIFRGSMSACIYVSSKWRAGVVKWYLTINYLRLIICSVSLTVSYQGFCWRIPYHFVALVRKYIIKFSFTQSHVALLGQSRHTEPNDLYRSTLYYSQRPSLSNPSYLPNGRSQACGCPYPYQALPLGC